MSALKRRNLRQYMRRTGASSSAITYTDSEPWALCYYLFTMFINKSNKRIISTFDSAIRCFLGLVRMLGRSERLTQVLDKEIKSLERHKLLTRNEDININMTFDNSDIPYSYDQDHEIDRAMSRYETTDETVVNLHRILYLTDKPVFSAIINTVIFRNSSNLSLNQSLKMSKKVEKFVFDIEKTRFLMDQVNLSEDEARFILMKCRTRTIEYFIDIFRSSDNCDNNFHNRMADMLGVSEKEYRLMLRNDGKLKSFGFLDDDGTYEDSLNECIEEQSIEPWFSDMLKPLDCSDAYTPDSFSLNAASRDVILDLLNGKNPVSILFYGKPGSGKTELAKTLAAQTGKKVYIFKNEAEACYNNRFNILGRLVCLLSMERPDSVIIVDEADSLLKTLDFSFFGTEPTKTKGTVNKMLENNRDKVIYIINHQQQIDVSTLRRFTFSVKFDAMSPAMLRQIALSKLSALELAEETRHKLADMFDCYKLTGASVDNVIKAIDGMQCIDENILLEKAGIVMKENSLLLNGKAKMRSTVRNEYDPRILNTSMNAVSVLNMVKNAVRYAEKNKGTENGIRMLFYGVSGTGKTELARYIAEKLHKPVLLKRASDILDKYVGGSEKNISNAFAEAESNGAVLLFDEADSFFSNRNQASRSWERTLVNEFLTQMEEFEGILICTTNLRNIMDPAMQRRFHILVEFKPLKALGIKTLADRYFPSWKLSKNQIAELEETDSVTPGDFGTLFSRIRFMDAADISSSFIFDELMKCQTEKRKSLEESGTAPVRHIGFTA